MLSVSGVVLSRSKGRLRVWYPRRFLKFLLNELCVFVTLYLLHLYLCLQYNESVFQNTRGRICHYPRFDCDHKRLGYHTVCWGVNITVCWGNWFTVCWGVNITV